LNSDRKIKRMVGAALMAIGLLVAALSGTCVIAFLAQLMTKPEEFLILLALAFMPLLFGVVAFWTGQRMRRIAISEEENGR
jgi:peptidoglycan/LPS O-acetylase OafA/YrhL